jgi:hypothetical protein
MPDPWLAFPRCQQKPVAAMVQHGHMRRDREVAPLPPEIESDLCSLNPVAALERAFEENKPGCPMVGRPASSFGLSWLVLDWIDFSLAH